MGYYKKNELDFKILDNVFLWNLKFIPLVLKRRK